MKKEIVIRTIASMLSWDGMLIDDLINDLNGYKEDGADIVRIELDDDDIEISVQVRRMETDEEFEVRKKKFEEHMEIKEQIDRAKYEELKKKFEGK
jgi:hypothetical protein